VILFDEESRQEFVTGFRKRKQQRRKIAAEQLERKTKRARAQHRKERKQLLMEQYGIPQVHAVQTESEKVDDVTIYDRSGGERDGENGTKVTVETRTIDPASDLPKFEEEEEEEEENREQEEKEGAPTQAQPLQQFPTRKDRLKQAGKFKPRKKMPWSKNVTRKLKSQARKQRHKQ